MEEREADLDRYRSVVDAALAEALSGVIAMRRAEGQALADDIATRVEMVERLMRSVEQRVPRSFARPTSACADGWPSSRRICRWTRAGWRRKWRFWPDRSDVSEETARVASHIASSARFCKREAP